MQSIGAELDSVFKEFCGFNVNDRKNIKDYAAKILSDDNSDIRNRVVKVPIADIKLQPFKEWNKVNPGQSLDWWVAFTSIKHNRYGNRKKANFKNTLSILGALFLLENLWLKRITEQLSGYKHEMIQLTVPDIFDNQSKLFERDWTSKCISLGNGRMISFE